MTTKMQIKIGGARKISFMDANFEEAVAKEISPILDTAEKIKQADYILKKEEVKVKKTNIEDIAKDIQSKKSKHT